MGKVIAFSNHKGGVGKTTSVVNVGAGLCNLGRRILLIDIDPQENLTQSFGVKENDFSIYEAMRGDTPLRPVSIAENLDIIPSKLELSGAEFELSSEAGREFILNELIAPLRDKYDYILIDCPPSLGLLTINALTCADEIFIPLQAHYLAIKGLTKITEVIDKVKKRLNKKLTIGGVIITQYDKRKVLHRDVADTIHTFFREKVFDAVIRDNIALAEAPSSGQDIFKYNPKSYGAEDYNELCKEILKREES
jgi:chromosome partitioning protein